MSDYSEMGDARMKPAFIITTDGILDEKKRRELAELWNNQFKPGYGMPILPAGCSVHPMSLSVENLRRALEKSDGSFQTYDRYPYREPPPLPWWITADPFVKLLIIALPIAAILFLMV